MFKSGYIYIYTEQLWGSMILHSIIPPIHASMPHKQAPLHYSAMVIKQHLPVCFQCVLHMMYLISLWLYNCLVLWLCMQCMLHTVYQISSWLTACLNRDLPEASSGQHHFHLSSVPTRLLTHALGSNLSLVVRDCLSLDLCPLSHYTLCSSLLQWFVLL